MINTRQYRSPEVTLQSVDWHDASDIWSAGCILMELYTGSLLFPTHDEVEHLAMIEKLCGPLPECLTVDCHPDLKDVFPYESVSEEEIQKRGF